MRLAELIPVGVVSGVLLGLTLSLTPRTPIFGGRDYDGRFYVAMAGDPEVPPQLAHAYPWCYRVLTPWIISKLPGDYFIRAKALDFFCYWITSIALYSLCRRFGADRSAAALGTVLFLLSFWGPRFSFYSVFYIEPMMTLLMIVGLWLALDRRYGLLTLLTPIMVLQRPQCMIVVIASFIREIEEQKLRSRATFWYAVMALLAAATYLILEFGVHAEKPREAGVLGIAGMVLLSLLAKPDYLLRSCLSVGIALGALPWLVLFAGGAREFLRKHLWLLAYVVLGLFTLLGGLDKGRLVFVIAPVLVVAASAGLSGLKSSPARMALAGAVIIAAHLCTQAPWVDLNDANAYLANFEPVHAKSYDAWALLTRIAISAIGVFAGIQIAASGEGPTRKPNIA